MGLGLPSGGHLTHGYYTAKRKISATFLYFESLQYNVHPEMGIIEYEGCGNNRCSSAQPRFSVVPRPTLAPSILRGSAPSRMRLMPSSWWTSLTSRASLPRSNTPLPSSIATWSRRRRTIGALAAQLLEVNTPEFVEDSKAVVSNAGTMAEALIAKGHKLASGRTDIHLVLWVLRPRRLTGSKVVKLCEAASISLNRNTVPGDASALSPVASASGPLR